MVAALIPGFTATSLLEAVLESGVREAIEGDNQSRPIFSPPSWHSFTEETPEASAFRGGIVIA